jgi:hypothetical protein
MTLVGLCVADENLNQEPVVLIDGQRSLSPVGGVVKTGSRGVVMYYLYPATTSVSLDVRLNGTDAGTLTFDGRQEWRSCPLLATGDYTFIACQSLMVVEWASPLRVSADDVALLDVQVSDEGGSLLGFYLEGLRNGARGLVVKFGFRPPTGNRVIVRAVNAYLKGAARSHLGFPVESTFLVVRLADQAGRAHGILRQEGD